MSQISVWAHEIIYSVSTLPDSVIFHYPQSPQDNSCLWQASRNNRNTTTESANAGMCRSLSVPWRILRGTKKRGSDLKPHLNLCCRQEIRHLLFSFPAETWHCGSPSNPPKHMTRGFNRLESSAKTTRLSPATFRFRNTYESNRSCLCEAFSCAYGFGQPNTCSYLGRAQREDVTFLTEMRLLCELIFSPAAAH